VLHFRKLEQQWKAPKEIVDSRPARYNQSKTGTNSYDNTLKHVKNIDLDGCMPPENWEKNFGLAPPDQKQQNNDNKNISTIREEAAMAVGEAVNRA
jgi:hypothetical protein